MNRSIRAALTATVALTILAGLPLAGAAAPTHLSTPMRPAVLGDGVANFTTTNNVDVTQVAVSPDGEFVSAITTGYQVLVFTNSTVGTPTPVATFTVPGNIDANSMAMSDLQAGGGPHLLVIGYGHVVLEFNLTAGGGNVNLNLQKPVWAIWNFTTLFNLPGIASYPIVHQVAISDSGQWLAVMADYSLTGTPFSIITYTDNFVEAFGQKYAGTALNLGIDHNGDWIVAGMTIGGGSAIMVFHENAWLGNYTNFGGQLLRSVSVSGSGALCYGVTLGGTYIVPTATPTTNVPNATISNQVAEVGQSSIVSPSYSGSQILISGIAGGGSGAAYYLNYSSNKWSVVWAGTYADPVVNASLSASDPNYFAVTAGTNVYWYYYYPGVPSSSTVYYRTMTTVGSIHESAMSEGHNTMAIGSAYVNGEQFGSGGEFTVVSDGGIPKPATPQVTVQVLTPSPGQGSAQFQVTWVEAGNAPISTYDVRVNASSTSPSASPITPSEVARAGNTSATVSGLSFSSTYCVEITAVAWGGASSATSAPVCATTPAQPQSVDPVTPFEVASASVLGLGVVGLVALTLLTGRRKKERLEPSPMGSGSPPPGYPPMGGP